MKIQSNNPVVVNCFQISIFAVHEQLTEEWTYADWVVNCFQISIFAVHEQPSSTRYTKKIVVNCFQISIFAVHEQPKSCVKKLSISCELLSN